MKDVTESEVIEVTISEDGKTLWVNGADGCLFRACRIKKLIVKDERRAKG